MRIFARSLTAFALGTLLTACQSSAPPPSPPGPSPSVSASDLPSFDPASRVGEIADGFPPDLVALVGTDDILSSSAQTSDGMLRFSLTVHSARSTNELTAAYDAMLLALGFTVIPMAAPTDLAAMTGYSRTTTGLIESMTIAILDDGTHRSVSVSGHLVAPTP